MGGGRGWGVAPTSPTHHQKGKGKKEREERSRVLQYPLICPGQGGGDKQHFYFSICHRGKGNRGKRSLSASSLLSSGGGKKKKGRGEREVRYNSPSRLKKGGRRKGEVAAELLLFTQKEKQAGPVRVDGTKKKTP